MKTAKYFNVIKDNSFLDNRYPVKAFKCQDDMYKFLGKQCDNSWRILEGHNLKSGVYFTQHDKTGTKYINVTKLYQ